MFTGDDLYVKCVVRSPEPADTARERGCKIKAEITRCRCCLTVMQSVRRC